ncbi:MAG: cell division protein ZapB [Treponema sp.]|nr:cell division protein ZapB [Treponema sp.]
MVSLDQVLVLEQKVESAVKKITQLQAENDALRRKCAELTNSLSSKSEQLSTFEQDQGLIESKIKNLINRFNNIENSVMDVIGQSDSNPTPVQQTIPNQPAQNTYPNQTNTVQPQVSAPETNIRQDSFQPVVQEKAENLVKEPVQAPVQNFFDMSQVPEETSDDSQPEDGQFDIF